METTVRPETSNIDKSLYNEPGFPELIEATRILRVFREFEKHYPEKYFRQVDSVAENLYKEPWRFEFFEAVRLLYLIQKFDPHPLNPETASLIRYKTNLTLNFPASEIQALKKVEKDGDEIASKELTELTVNFMGLTGPLGVLPRHYTDYLLVHKARYKDTTAHQFFDLFSHRAISLFVKAWEKYRFYIGYERNQTRNTMRYLLDLIGMGTTGLQERLAYGNEFRRIFNVPKPYSVTSIAKWVVDYFMQQSIADEMMVFYSGLIGQKPHSAVALEAILKDYFKVKVEVLQFQGCWLRLDSDQYSRLGKRGIFNKLGETVVIGKCVLNLNTKFRVRIGPLNWNTFVAFLPMSGTLTGLKRFITWYKQLEHSFDVQLVLQKDEVKACCLGDGESARLGWSTWLGSQRFLKDADDTVLTC